MADEISLNFKVSKAGLSKEELKKQLDDKKDDIDTIFDEFNTNNKGSSKDVLDIDEQTALFSFLNSKDTKSVDKKVSKEEFGDDTKFSKMGSFMKAHSKKTASGDTKDVKIENGKATVGSGDEAVTYEYEDDHKTIKSKTSKVSKDHVSDEKNTTLVQGRKKAKRPNKETLKANWKEDTERSIAKKITADGDDEYTKIADTSTYKTAKQVLNQLLKAMGVEVKDADKYKQLYQDFIQSNPSMFGNDESVHLDADYSKLDFPKLDKLKADYGATTSSTAKTPKGRTGEKVAVKKEELSQSITGDDKTKAEQIADDAATTVQEFIDADGGNKEYDIVKEKDEKSGSNTLHWAVITDDNGRKIHVRYDDEGQITKVEINVDGKGRSDISIAGANVNINVDNDGTYDYKNAGAVINFGDIKKQVEKLFPPNTLKELAKESSSTESASQSTDTTSDSEEAKYAKKLSENKEASNVLGNEIYIQLKDASLSSNSREKLDKLSGDNIDTAVAIESFNKKSSNEHILKYIANEDGLTGADANKVLKPLLDEAKKLGLENTQDYKDVKQFYDAFASKTSDLTENDLTIGNYNADTVIEKLVTDITKKESELYKPTTGTVDDDFVNTAKSEHKISGTQVGDTIYQNLNVSNSKISSALQNLSKEDAYYAIKEFKAKSSDSSFVSTMLVKGISGANVGKALTALLGAAEKLGLKGSEQYNSVQYYADAFAKATDNTLATTADEAVSELMKEMTKLD